MRNEKKWIILKMATVAGDATKITQHCGHVGSNNMSRLKWCQIGNGHVNGKWLWKTWKI